MFESIGETLNLSAAKDPELLSSGIGGEAGDPARASQRLSVRGKTGGAAGVLGLEARGTRSLSFR
jgi:hypothetical protein